MKRAGSQVVDDWQIPSPKPHSGSDIVQFSSPNYYVKEEEAFVTVEVMRMGTLKGEVDVSWSTEDVSAVAGERYEASSGKILFKENESSRTLEVRILSSKDWCPTLEFKIRLKDPDNCYLGLYLQTCTIKVIDDDIFPSDKYRDDIMKDKEGVRDVSPLGLFWEFVKMNFHQSDIHLKTVVTLIFDQLHNGYAFVKLLMQAYMVNVIFKINSETEEKLFIPGDRAGTAAVIGAGYILPMVLLHIWDYVRIRMDIEGNTRVYLSTCLFRRFLNYDEESRQYVAPAEMQLGLLEETRDLASGYTAVLELAQMFGKLAIMLFFVLLKEPSAIWLVLLMPALISAFGFFRGNAVSTGRREKDRKEREMIGIIEQTCEKYTTIKAYFRRSAREELYRYKADAVRCAELPVHIVMNNNLYAAKWLGPLFAGLYICLAAPAVLNGDVKLGFFLATISIISEMSGLFLAVYERYQRITEISEPLMTLTIYYNLETEFKPLKKNLTDTSKWMHNARAEVLKMQAPAAETKMMRTDLIPIVLDTMTFQYGKEILLKSVTVSTPQGQVIGITGNHGVGKATLLKLLASVEVPYSGYVLIPPHLRVLLIAQEPCILLDLSLWENLTLGCPDGIDSGLVHTILEEMEMDNVIHALDTLGATVPAGPVTSRSMLSNGLQAENSSLPLLASEPGKIADKDKNAVLKKKKELALWFEKLNYTEKVKIHLARGFMMNPEVMVMHRPLYHFDDARGKVMMQLIRHHQTNRGLGMPVTTLGRRRPRTIFLTVDMEKEWEKKSCDILWYLDSKTRSLSSSKSTGIMPWIGQHLGFHHGHNNGVSADITKLTSPRTGQQIEAQGASRASPRDGRSHSTFRQDAGFQSGQAGQQNHKHLGGRSECVADTLALSDFCFSPKPATSNRASLPPPVNLAANPPGNSSGERSSMHTQQTAAGPIIQQQPPAGPIIR